MSSPAATLAALRPLRGTPAERLDHLAPVLDAWADPASHVRRALLGALPALTGFHAQTTAFGLSLQCARLAPDVVAEGLSAHPRLLGERRNTAIFGAGNIPGLAPLDILWSVLAGDPVAVKVSSSEPVTGSSFARDVNEREAHAVCAAFSWPRTDEERNRELLAWAGDTLAYGTDATIEALRDAVRRLGGGRRFLGCGHRISVAWVSESPWSIDEIARRLATDACIWDQEGCLSPHVAFVSPEIDPVELGESLARAFRHLAIVLPAGERSVDDRAARRARWNAIEARALRGGISRLWRDEGGAWSIGLEDDDSPLLPSPLGRTLLLRRAPTMSDALLACSIWTGKIQAVGVGDDPRRHEALVPILASLGVTRLCALGRMQEPGPTWFGEEGRFTPNPVNVDPATDGAWRSLFDGQ